MRELEPRCKSLARSMVLCGFISPARAWEVVRKRNPDAARGTNFEDFEDWFVTFLDGEQAT